jgi:purine-cytosine permease-like protein
MIGMGAAIFTGESDIAKIMVKAGLGAAGLLIIIFSTVTTTFMDAYSAGVSTESISKKLNAKWVGVIVTIIGAVGAMIYPMDDITSFLYLIGSVFAPMVAIQIADYFILKRNHITVKYNWTNLIIWLIGFLIYRLLMKVDTFVGNTLPDMAITIIICVLFHKFGFQEQSGKTIIKAERIS